MTREQAIETLRSESKTFEAADALETLLRDPTCPLEDVMLGLDHEGFIAEQAAFALYARTKTPLPDDSSLFITDRQEWQRRIEASGENTHRTKTASGHRPESRPA